MSDEITLHELKAAQDIAKPFHATLGGKRARTVLIACGLLLRAIIEENMVDPGDEDERTRRMESVMNLIFEVMTHQAVNRKMQSS